MARSGPVAVQGNGHSDSSQHAHQPIKLTSQHHDITPEVFRRFMTYERTLLNNDASPSSAHADLDGTSPTTESENLPSVPFALAQANVRRRIRGMPKRASHASQGPSVAGALSPLGSQDQAAPPRLASDDSSYKTSSQTTSSQTHALTRTSHRLGTSVQDIGTASKDASVPSQALSQHFQQLHLSSHPQSPATVSLTAPELTAPGESGRISDSESHFRFPSLPAKLTDDGFHYRQRAAQFILLYSQQASPENLSKYNRLSSPLFYGPYDSSAFTVPGSYTRGGARNHGSHLHGLEESSCSAALDDDESVHSHHHVHNASDDESEYLDFDACRTAHLGNKKKRKSSRFSSPGASGLASIANPDKGLQNDAVHLPSNSGPAMSTSIGADPHGRERALVEMTSTIRQTVSRADNDNEHKQVFNVPAPSELPSVRRHTFVRLPPRPSSAEHQRAALRGRIRARLAFIFQQRRLDRRQEEARQRQEQQALREVQQAQSKADLEAPTTPEKRAPPKRALKAGKRAQAIRGSNSSAKPLTIAEIRARAAAAAGGGNSSFPSTSSVKVNGSPSPTQNTSRSKDTPTKRGSKISSSSSSSPSPSPSPSREREHVVSKENPGAETITPTAAQIIGTSAGKTSSSRTLAAPTSSFDFRMSSAITLRLRELRSQLDAATRNLSDSGRQGDTHAMAKALSKAVAAPPSVPAPVPNSRRNESVSDPTKHNDGLPDHAPPWVRHALEFQHQLEQRQMIGAKPGPTRQPVKTAPTPLPPPPAPSQSRSGTLTPAQPVKHQPSTAPPKLTPVPAPRGKAKAANGRRTATRKPTTESAHQHGASCKHGFGHGRQHGIGSALFTDDDWICVFCEYELYYGEAPLMLRACRNRKKLVEKKSKAKSKAQAALQKKPSAKTNGAGGCGHHHDHEHDHHHHDHEHDHDHHHGCEYDHEHTCHHDHGSACGSDEYDHDHHDHHEVGNSTHKSRRHRPQPHNNNSHHHHHKMEDDATRERCDCGNSIHSSDFDDEDK
ncbi:uncharacterized protein UTRI_01353 [Ustilago trichophora]|uniref:Uncharacterized protein n=1 Tax=Ustilago trichophora TaxID=86804 RepID=A0A5C3DWG8_9BASI|nr:uncharacterized protein UTRI_01353 [Ustilago trichophora]